MTNHCGDCINFEETNETELDWCAWHLMEVDAEDNPINQCCKDFENIYGDD